VCPKGSSNARHVATLPWLCVKVVQVQAPSITRVEAAGTPTDGTTTCIRARPSAQQTSVGSRYDNAPIESLRHPVMSASAALCVSDPSRVQPNLFYFIEGFYNREHLHSSLDLLNPVPTRVFAPNQRACSSACPPNQGKVRSLRWPSYATGVPVS
jgi:hypothetical protein